MGVKDLFFSLFLSNESICVWSNSLSRMGTNDNACFHKNESDVLKINSFSVYYIDYRTIALN